MSQLIVIENGQLYMYHLDEKNVWEIGRVTKNNCPDIALHTMTVSRKHGCLQNMDGIWFYLDYHGKNGTVYRDRHIEAGLHGRVKPIMLTDGDVLILGGGKEAVIDSRTVWMLFSTSCYGEEWKKEDVKVIHHLMIKNEAEVMEWEKPTIGTVLTRKTGMAIFMGDAVYLIGKMELIRESVT